MLRKSKELKVGVIGLGNMGQNHVRVLSQLGVLFNVFDISREVTESTALKYNVSPIYILDEIIDLSDVLFVITPTSSHYSIAKKIIQKGKDIFIEKPFTLSSLEAKDLISLANKNGVKIQIGHIERYNPIVRELKRILVDEEIISVDIKRLSSFDPRIHDTDVIFDLMIHDIDVLFYLLNDEIDIKGVVKKSIYSESRSDHVAMVAETSSGILLNVTASRVTEEKIRSIAITTLHSYIFADYLTKNIQICKRTNLQKIIGEATYRQENIVEKVYVPNYEPLFDQDSDFIDAVVSDKKVFISGEDGLRAIQFAEKLI
ncbi:oxidoreductase [Lysinibacillus contaminans]|uniref:Oxidoreductase n=1 Tax=Lysinibacillus contaminans TaxID=1293441 RepID=A0ABR5JWY9_9BACI|nr:Gfo/Idh/MocA family oxidoreductase [Lysinibacillus contaminans]KOS66681.1 oxidoreductase [Lysinibacillus contaminans]